MITAGSAAFRTQSPGRINSVIGGFIGGVFVVVGLLRFTVSGEHPFAGHTGSNLVLFQVNGLHNVVHLTVGLVLIQAAIAGARAARTANTAIGAVYLVPRCAGPVPAGCGRAQPHRAERRGQRAAHRHRPRAGRFRPGG